jgi:ubiquinone/menaquinone biosynthesis C-methylase UbiE
MEIKESIKVIKKKDIFFLLDQNGKIRKFRPWLGDMFSFLYDRIMEKSVFPKKFMGSIEKHFDILKEEYQKIQGRNVLEIATGSGFTASLLNPDNSYAGIDISRGLLICAVKKFKQNNFRDTHFFVVDAKDMPFVNDFFDVVICDLSLNFIGDIEVFIQELKRVMKKEAVFYCSVPMPERKSPKVQIHGSLYSENELKIFFEKYNFSFIPKQFENGALLYFEAKLNSKD